MSARRRWLIVVLGALAVLLGLAVGGLVWLQGPGGSAFIRARALVAVKDSIAGRVELGGVELSGDRVVLGDVKLFTPEGQLVFEVHRVEATVDLIALARGRVKLSNAVVDAPRLYLVEDAQGLNLSRAIAAKTAPAAGGAASPVHLEVRGLALTGGFVDYQSPEQRVTVDGLQADGAVDLVTEPLRLEGELKLKGAMRRPLEAPLELHVTAASPKAGAVELTTALALGKSHFDGRLAWPALEVNATELSAAPETVRAFVPQWPLEVPVSAEGRLSLREGAVTAHAGQASLTVSGAWDAGASSVERFSLAAANVNLAELVGGRPTRLSVTAKGALTDARPDTLAGHVTLQGAWESADSKPRAKVSLSANAKGGAVVVDQAVVELPGARLTGGGRVTRSLLALTAHLDATDLSQLSALTAEFTAAPLQLGGNGALDLTVSGSLTHPGVAAKGRLAVLRLGPVAADSLDVDVTVADLTRPLDADGVLSMMRLRIGERAFDEVTAKLATQGRQLDAELSMRGLGDLTVLVSGLIDPDSRGIMLAALGLQSAVTEWKLEAPAHVGWPGETIDVAPLTLRSGDQRVTLQLKKAGSRLDGSLVLAKVNLATLPRALVPEALGLAGLADGQVKVAGRLPRPDVDASLKWSGGAVQGFTDLDAALDGAYRSKRATGKVRVSSGVGTLAADFELPLDAWLADRDEAWRAHVSVSKVDLKHFASVSKTEVPVAAVVSAEADLEGSTLSPKVTVTVEAPAAVVQAPIAGATRVLTFKRVKATVATREGGKLALVLSTGAFGGTVVATLETPFTLAELRHGPPTVEQLRQAVGTLDVEANGIDLTNAHELGLTEDDELAGTLGVKATLHGSADKPRGQLTATVAHAVVHPLENFEITATLVASDERTTLAVAVSVAGKPALTVDGALAVAIEQLPRVEDIGARAVAVTGRVFEVELSLLRPPAERATGLQGAASASFDVSGTLDAPRVHAAGAVQGLTLAKVSMGSARFDWKGLPGEQTLTVALGGQGREDLKVRGTVGIDLSLAAFRKGLDVAGSALALAVEARELDVGFLGGVTPTVRTVGGRVTMKGDVSGTIGLPRFRGDASWSNGRLSLLGLGEYREIDLAVHATNDLIDLQRLRLRAGSGRASLKGIAKREGDSDAFHLAASGSFEKFPVVVDDQLVATASFKFTADGQLTDKDINLTNLELPRVDVELPDVKRKDLQNLERPADIIIVRGGQRLSSRVRREAQAKARLESGAAPGRTFRALINAPRNIWVRSTDVNVELGLSENFRVEVSDQVQLFGEVDVLRGRITVIGRELEVQKTSQLRFAGPVAQPYVNVLATYTNEREKVKVTVTVVGRGTEVTLKTTSDPPMTESDIYTLLATGRRELRRGSGSSVTPEQAVSAVGNLAAAQLKQVLAKKLPIDVINFEASENFQSVKLDFGKYLSDSVYLGYTFQPGAREDRGENAHAGRIEFQFSRNWALEAYAGTAPAAGADVMWSRDF